MVSNSETIIQDVRVQFEQMLDFVTGETAQRASAYQMESGLFKLLVSLGAKLLELFFLVRSENSERTKVQLADGQELPYHRDTARNYYSLFGKLRFERPYFYKKGIGHPIPLDEALSLQPDGYSDLLRELSGYLDVDHVYAKTADMFQRLLGLSLSTRSLQGNILEDAVEVLAYYDQKAPPIPVDICTAKKWTFQIAILWTFRSALDRFSKTKKKLSQPRNQSVWAKGRSADTKRKPW